MIRPEVLALLKISPELRERYQDDVILHVHIDSGQTIEQILVGMSKALGGATAMACDAIRRERPTFLAPYNCPHCGKAFA